MPRRKGSTNRDNRGVEPTGQLNQVDDSIWEVKTGENGKVVAVTLKPEVAKKIDGETLEGMSKTNRMRLTHSDPNSLTLRQKQAAGAEYLASLVGHPEFRRRIAEEALKDPVSVLKIASSERPKEVHLEADITHSIVVVPTQLTPDEWNQQVQTLEGEVVKEEKPW